MHCTMCMHSRHSVNAALCVGAGHGGSAARHSAAEPRWTTDVWWEGAEELKHPEFIHDTTSGNDTPRWNQSVEGYTLTMVRGVGVSTEPTAHFGALRRRAAMDRVRVRAHGV